MKQSRRSLRWLSLIIVVQLVLGLAYIVITPPWQLHESDFLRVPRIIRDHGRLPIPEDYPDGGFDTLNVNQPPLYYFLLLPVVYLFDDRAPIPSPAQTHFATLTT
jgi:hypothetical protein